MRRDGQVVWAEIRYVQVRDAQGKLVAIEGIARDVTQPKRMEERLLLAQRLETAGRVAAQVAHDFNNLLTPLSAHPHLIKMQLPSDHHAVRLCDSMIEAAQQMATINETFLTTKTRSKKPGSGPGLSIVQAIVEDHRGYLDLESEVGKGSTFKVCLPASREAVMRRPTRETDGGDETILVVDDDPMQREVLENLLESMGYHVAAAASGEEAVVRVSECPVDLLILDMVMPGGIDGAETLRGVREVKPGLRAIVVSGYAETDRVHEAQLIGAGPFLMKPLARERLAKAIRAELEHPA